MEGYICLTFDVPRAQMSQSSTVSHRVRGAYVEIPFHVSVYDGINATGGYVRMLI